MDDLQTKPCKHKVYLFFVTAYLMMLLQLRVFMYTDKTIKTKNYGHWKDILQRNNRKMTMKFLRTFSSIWQTVIRQNISSYVKN